MMTAARRDEAFAAIPDPGRARTLDELIEGLRCLKVWAGDPSYEWITRRINDIWTAAGRPAGDLAKKPTVVDCFKPGRRRLNTDLVIAVVRALHPDVGYVAQWRQALRVVGGETRAAAQVRVQDRLPPDLAGFTGRVAELDRLRQALRHNVVSTLAGMAGVGKTELAVHAGHLLLREKVFDRVLFVSLRGFHPDPAQPPADPAAVLDGFLRLLGVSGQQMPHELHARAAVYRSRLAGTHTLVVLDNAADAEQVRPLLPQTPGCAVLITSRRSLTDLQPATHLTVAVFTPGDALHFLARTAPHVPVGDDPDAAARIAARCGYLPLALGLVAGHIRATPGWTLTDHADRLDERHRQQRLDSGVELALDLSYQHLPAEQQRLLRLLALHPGQDFDAYAAAALADTDLGIVQTHLDRLCQDHLLQQGNSDRYTFHDLIRAYAAGRAGDHDPPPQRREALTRLSGFYLATAAAAMDVAYPHGRQHRPAVPAARTPAPDLPDPSLAGLWLDAELANLSAVAQHAAQHDRPQHIWWLSSILDGHLFVRGRYREAQSLHHQALDLARRHGNRQAEMNALTGLGYYQRRLGHHEQGDNFERALRIAREIGDRAAEQTALRGLGVVHRALDRYEQSGGYFEQALRIAQDIGDRAGQRYALSGLADIHRLMGRYVTAAGHSERALQIAQDIGDRAGQRYSLTGLGHVHWMLGQFTEAGDHFERALWIAQDIGERIGELHALHGLGHIRRMLGRHGEAADCYRRMLDVAQEFGSGNWRYEALQGLGRLHHAAGDLELALTHHEKALHLAIDLAQPADQARAHDGLAHAHHALGNHDQARRHWQQALDILTCLGTEHTEDIEASLPNIRDHLVNLGTATD